MKNRNIIRSICLIGISLLAGAILLQAQSNLASLVGTARDASGGVVPGVTVTVINTLTNQSKQYVTDSSGNYEIVNLIPGLYRVEGELVGFKKFLRDGIQLDSSAIVRVDVSLEVGSPTATVVVESGTPAIETETPAVAALAGEREHQVFPTHLGDMSYLMAAMPQVQASTVSKYIYSISGTRGAQNEFLVDGIAAPNRTTPSGSSIMGMEGTAETRVQSTNNSAEFASSGTYQQISKSGTNRFHGTAEYDHFNSFMAARGFFSPTKAVQQQHFYPGVFSGPLIVPGLYNGRDRTFFMVSYDGFNYPLAATIVNSVPTAAMRQGNFSGIANIKDPTTGKAFPGNIIPSSLLNPSALKVQELFFPTPNYGDATTLANNSRIDMHRFAYRNGWNFRIDHRLTDKNSLYGRFEWAAQPTQQNPVIPTLGLFNRTNGQHDTVMSDSHSFTPHLVNEFRVGYISISQRNWGQQHGQDIIKALGLKGLESAPDDIGMPQIAITGMTTISSTAAEFHVDRTYQFTDSLTWIRGRHSMKGGIDMRYLVPSEEVNYQSSSWGAFSFQGTFSGTAYADFLLGLPRTATNGPPTPPLNNYEKDWFFFIQDDFRIMPQFTISMGLRYEYQQPFTVTDNRLYNFDPTKGQIVIPDDAKSQVSPRFNPSLPIVTASQAGFPSGTDRFADKNNFAPRLGFAYRFKNTVIRGGYGIFVDNIGVGLSDSYTGGPFTQGTVQYTNSITGGVPLFQWPNAFPTASAGPSTSQPSLNALNPHYINPYIQQWSLSLGHEILGMGVRASYIGTKGTQLLFQRQINRPLPSTTTFNQNRRPYPLYGDIVYTDNGGNSIYHGLQIEANRRFAKGLAYNMGYTWSSIISDVADSGQAGATIQDPLNRSAERAKEAYNLKHRFVGSFIWQVPVGRGRSLFPNLPAFAEQILGGWEISAIGWLQSGMPFTPSFTGFDPSNTNTIGGRPDRLGNGNLPSDQRSLYRWFDLSAFAVPPSGRFGNSGRDILIGPGLRNLNLSLGKDFRLNWVKEGVLLNVLFTAKDALNHPNFSQPNTVVNGTAGAGGVISSTNDTLQTATGRQCDIKIRISF
jgi:hypothetical protein